MNFLKAVKSAWARTFAMRPATTSDYYPGTSVDGYPNVTHALARNAGKLNAPKPVYVHANNHTDNCPWENYDAR